MAIEKVHSANNTSVVQDEVLAHKLGLIPLKIDSRLFNFKSGNDEPNEKNTIVFKLHSRCERGSSRIKDVNALLLDTRRHAFLDSTDSNNLRLIYGLGLMLKASLCLWSSGI
ncbi:hypothetical protein CASFOL_024473 [Castilleja foliolosa]|uniref:DNA-directed RNA polymerase RpoA/D/Rpb3-type domain-containing protein n=1 Tax=Castilleja foliolosa TaxID=1961234 RepID=A0ABD3CQS0_9LAMI